MAQEYKSQIQWLPSKNELINGKEQLVINFADANYLLINPGLPALLLTPSFEKITLVKTNYVALTKEELNLVDTSLISTTPTIHAMNGMLYKKPIVYTYIFPFRKNVISGKIEKLVSFAYTGKNAPVASKRAVREAAKKLGTTKSVLSEGDWFKLSIAGAANATGSGMYKMDYNFLNSIGFPVATVDPRKIKLYGNGGGMLPMANSVARPDDLMENAIYIFGESDGKFDPADYILFYAQGPHVWKYDKLKKEFNHEKNLYSETSNYFLTPSETDGLRVSAKANSYTGGTETTTFPDYVFYESDEFNLLESGNKWYTKAIDYPMNFQYNTQGIVPNSSIEVVSSVMAQAKLQTNFTLNVNGQSFNQSVSAYSFSLSYGDKGRQEFKSYITTNIGAGLNIALSYNKGGNSSSRGFLDYIEAHFTRQIGLYGNQSNFRVNGFDNAEIKKIKINTPSPATTSVWDVTVPYNCIATNTLVDNNQLVFTDSIASLKEYIAFTGSAFATPSFAGKVANQNLHALDAGNLPDMVIITREDFVPQANQLKAFRKQHDNFDVEVVTTNQVYNEFSSGAQDLTALRDFLKLLYHRGTNTDSVKYVLLLGSTSYDCKDRIGNNTNIIPVFESNESMDNVNSYSSEDYIVLLDSNEGEWETNPSTFNSLDMGIGRLPVRNTAEAQNLVNKIITYHTHSQSLGKWRNRISFVADDTSPPNEFGKSSHVRDAEESIKALMSMDKNLNIDKFYLNAYPQVSSPGGEVSPAIKEALLRNINKGTLMVNYSGHGSEFGWAQEDIININDINSLKNKYVLPFFVTATCEFGRYDDPNKFSGALSLVLNPEGGAIGMLCSTRPVYQSYNILMNTSFYRALFPTSTKKRVYPTMGDVHMISKNNAYSSIFNRNYTLLCDPSLTLAFPEEEVVIKSINNKPFDQFNQDTLKALSLVTIQGEIQKNEVLQKNFFGNVTLSFFDKTNKLTTIDAFPNDPMNYELRNNVIYDGAVSVDSGKFTFKFIIPKDINYNIGSAKLSFYAQSKDGRDAGNADTTTQIGGSSSVIAADNTPPTIRLFMDDSTFVSGGLTNTNTKLIAKLYDENGINISSSSIGHEITGRLNNGNEVVIMNEFYSADNNSYQRGKVSYPFADLAPGTYNLTFKAWDTYNNSSSSNIEFVVAESEKLALKQVMNFPNPFADKTNFSFDHNRAGETLLVKIEITDNMGRTIKTLIKTIANSANTIKDIEWEGADDGGSRISAGSYIYKITVTAEKDKANAFEVRRLVMLN